MKNRETWEFAHQYIGRLWYVCGLILLPVSVLAMLFVIGKDINTVALIGTVVCTIQLIPAIGTIIPTEIALKNRFDSQGNRI